MKKSVITAIITAVTTIILAACEKTGYIGTEQESVVARLTAYNWVVQTVTYPGMKPEVYENGNQIYSFETSGKGYCRYVNPDPDKDDTVTYFQWAFTNDTFSVVYFSDGYSMTYWLIDKLTDKELHVTCANQDPVIYPNIYKTKYVFKAISKNQ